MPDFGTAPRRILPGVWVTRTGRRLDAAGNQYWEQQLRAGAVDRYGHYNHQIGNQFRAAQHGATPLIRKHAGIALGNVHRQQQEALTRQAELGASFTPLFPILAARDTVRDIQHGNYGAAGVASLGVLPVGRLARGGALGVKLGTKLLKGEREAKIAAAGLDVKSALVVGDKVQHVVTPRSRIAQVAFQRPASAISHRFPEAPIIGARARVAKAAARDTVEQARVVNAKMAIHTRPIAHAASQELGPKDVAHWWWAQVPEKMRNIAGLKTIVNRMNQERVYIQKGHALSDLQSDLTEAESQLAQAATKADKKFWKAEKQSLEGRMNSLDLADQNLGYQVGLLEKTIAKAPKLDQRVMKGLRALETDRRALGVQAGKLDPKAAAEREKLVSDWLGIEPDGSEIYMGHRLGEVQGANPALVPRSMGVGKPRLPQGWAKKNQSILLNTGGVRPSLHVALEDWQAAHHFRSAIKTRKDLGAMGEDFTQLPANLNDHMIVNMNGKLIPKGWKVDQLGRLKDAGYDSEEIRQAAQHSLDNMILDPQVLGAQGMRDAISLIRKENKSLEGLRIVPRGDVERYFTQIGAGVAGKGGRVYDQMLAGLMTQMIFLRLGYIPKNWMQNLIMIAPHQGLFFAFNAPRAAALIPHPGQSDLDRQLWDVLVARVGGGATSGALEGMGKGGLGRVSQGVNKVVTGVADSPLRVSAMIHELSKEKIVSKFNPVWTEKEKKATLEFLTNESSSTVMAKASNVSHRATDSMADFNRMSPGARRIARRFFIVPNWLVAGTRYPAYFAGSYPGRSAAIAYAATGEPGLPGEIAGHRIPQNDPIWQYLAKGTPPWATGFPFGDKVARVGSVLPASMMGDIGLSLATGNPYEAGQYINPAITAGVTGLMGYVPHPNYMEHVGPLDALSQNFQHLAPNKKLIEDLINRSGSTTYPDDKTILGRLARETGVLPIHVSRGTSKGAKGSSTHYHRKRRRRSRSHSDTLDNVLKGSSGAGDTSGGGALDSVLK